MAELLNYLADSKNFFASANELYDNNLLLSFQACSSRCECSTWFRVAGINSKSVNFNYLRH